MRLPVLIVCSLWACASHEHPPGVLRDDVDTLELPPSATGARQPWETAGFRSAETAGGALVAWRPLAGSLPKNQHFDLEVWVVRDGVPVTEAELIVRATMPEHGHGMNVEPRAFARSDGAYRVRGLLLHMSGRWELAIHVVERGKFERATFELDVR